MFNNKKPVIIIGLLIFLVIIYFLGNSLNEIQELRRELNNLQEDFDNLRTHIDHQTASIRGEINHLKNQDLWWSQPIFEYMDLIENKMLVRINWQIKDYRKGNMVKFNYLPDGKKEYKQVVAEEKSPGFFAVTLPLKIPLEPIINVHFRSNNAVDQKIRPNIVREYSSKENEYGLQYYISLHTKEQTFTSRIYEYNLKQLSYQLFNPLQVHLNSTNKNNITVTINENMGNYSIREKPFTIKNISLQVRNGQEIIQTWPADLFTPPDYKGEDRFYSPHGISIEEDYESLYIVIEYTGGFTYEKEIFSF